MNGPQLHRVMRQAVEQGLLPPSANPPAQDARPWPVVLLTALGAWLAAVPLIGVVGLLLGDLASRSAGPYAIGLLVLAGAVVVLRSRDVPLFVEQLAVPALLVGLGALAFGVFRDLSTQAGAAVLAAVTLALGIALPRPWLRVLAGAAAAVLAAIACTPERWFTLGRHEHAAFWLAWHLAFALWLTAVQVQRAWLADGARARIAAAVEAVAAGWLLATLAGLAWWSGTSMLVGASAGGAAGTIAREIAGAMPRGAASVLPSAASVALAAAAAWRMALAWPALRQLWCAGVALVLLVLAAFMPALGAALLALAWCAASHRWRLAAAGALAAAWVLGSFYYRLDWPLATKALVMVAAGAWLAALAWLSWRTPAPASNTMPRGASPRAAHAGIALTALATLAVVNVGIWQKQSLIAHGQPVFIELAPVDPRALMQGDYMQLNFRLPTQAESQLDGLVTARRPRLVAQRDARGVATLQRLDDGTALAANELRIELTPKNGRWTVVSDAWFFREGEARRWAPARYGEFRVDDDGRALLVGLRGAQLEAL